jgi:hypothetical protein
MHLLLSLPFFGFNFGFLFEQLGGSAALQQQRIRLIHECLNVDVLAVKESAETFLILKQKLVEQFMIAACSVLLQTFFTELACLYVRNV